MKGSQAPCQTMNTVLAAISSASAYTHIRVYNALFYIDTQHTYYVCKSVKNAFVKTIKSTLPIPQCSLKHCTKHLAIHGSLQMSCVQQEATGGCGTVSHVFVADLSASLSVIFFKFVTGAWHSHVPSPAGDRGPVGSFRLSEKALGDKISEFLTGELQYLITPCSCSKQNPQHVITTTLFLHTNNCIDQSTMSAPRNSRRAQINLHCRQFVTTTK